MKKINTGQLLRVTVGVIAASLVSGCSWMMGDDGYFRDRSGDYRKAQSIEQLKVPEGTDTTAMKDLYAFPGEQRLPRFKADFEAPKPDSIVGGSQKDIRAFKSGTRYWITMNSVPSEVWARVRRFWEINGVQLESEVPPKGLMETAWLSREKGGKETRDKFRVRIEHGMHKGSAEVYLMHLGFPANGDQLPDSGTLDWSAVTEGDELAIAIMQEIAAFLIDTEYEGAPASLLAQSFVGSPKASVGADENGNMILLLKLDFDRAWEAVGKAIEEAKIPVDDKDRSAGTYYVSYPSELPKGKKKTGFFSFLKFGKNESDNKFKRMTVSLNVVSEQIVVAVQIDEELENSSSLPESLLADIRENLI